MFYFLFLRLRINTRLMMLRMDNSLKLFILVFLISVRASSISVLISSLSSRTTSVMRLTSRAIFNTYPMTTMRNAPIKSTTTDVIIKNKSDLAISCMSILYHPHPYVFHLRYRTGTKINVTTAANESPNIIENASGDHSPDAYVSGIIPITVVKVVNKIGRSLCVAPSIATSVFVHEGLRARN